MLMILKNAQKRETEASLPCEKSTLLTVTILLSAAPRDIKADDPLRTRFVAELCESLEAPMTSRVAAGCIRTLLLAGSAPAALLIEAVAFLSHPVDLEGLVESRALTAQSLTMYVAKTPKEQQPAALNLVMQCLLERASKEGPGVYQESAARFLDLASVDNAAFKAVVTCMDGKRKHLLESILKARNEAQQKRMDLGSDREPTIALKMNFGNA
jgi:HEAT repeat-containing protein 5